MWIDRHGRILQPNFQIQLIYGLPLHGQEGVADPLCFSSESEPA